MRVFFSPHGRIGSLVYFLSYAALTPLFFAFSLGVNETLRGALAPSLAFFFIAFGFLLLWVTGCLIVKRLHDLDLRGWWWVIPIAASKLTPLPLLYAATLALGLFPGDLGTNRFGAEPAGLKRWRMRFQLWRLARQYQKGILETTAYMRERTRLLAFYLPPKA